MQTRGNRLDYFALNDGYQSDEHPEDLTSRLSRSPTAQDPGIGLSFPSQTPNPTQSAVSAYIDSYLKSLDDEVLPTDSASQLPTNAASS